MIVLVTGCAGFLGSHLAESFLKQGHSVVGIDNFWTGQNSNIERLKKQYKQFQFFNHDVRNKLTGNYKLKHNFNIICNLACPASPPKYQSNPIATMMTSIQGIYNCLELADINGSTVLQASTSEVYGDPTCQTQSESYWGNVNPVGVRSCYDEGKRAAEAILTDWNREKQTNHKIVRIFNTYGPYMDPYDGRVVTNFITQALNNKDITVYGSGNQTRSFCYVTDLISGIRKLIDSDITCPVNIGNPDEFTILELAKLVLEKTGSSSRLVYNELPEDDPKQRRPNITLAKSMGWSPTINLNRGLDLMINYIKGL